MKPTDKAILGMVSELPGRVAACSPARDITLPCWRSRLDWMERRTRPKAEVAESHTVCAIAPLVPRQVTSLLLIDRSADRPEARNAPSCTVKSPTVLLCPHLHLFRLTPNFLCLNLQYVLYVYTSHVTVTPNRYRHTLEKLTGEPPATKTALISVLLPEIESALASGKTRRQIWQRLVEDGFDLSYDTFHST